MPNLRVTNHTKDELDRIKAAEEHTTFDSVIRTLVRNYDVSE